MLVLDCVKELVQAHARDAPEDALDVEIVIQVAVVAPVHAEEIANPDVKDALHHVQVLAAPPVEVTVPVVVPVALVALLVVQTLA